MRCYKKDEKHTVWKDPSKRRKFPACYSCGDAMTLFSILSTKPGASRREDFGCHPAPRAEIVMVDYRVNEEIIECV